MSTIFDIRKLRLPQLSKAAVIIGSLVVALGLVAALVGWQLYDKLTNNTVVAYFPAANALYAGDKVQIMGIRVGAIDKIEPTGDQMKVTFHYRNKYKVPADASAVVLNPTLVASRSIQLEPPYKGGPQLADNAVIPIERTQVPVEWDELRNSITHIIGQLGPTKEQPKGPFGDVIESFADGLAGKGQQINTTLNSLSNALSTLDEGRGDFFSVLRSLAMFVNALHQDDQQFVALNKDLAQLTDNLTSSDQSAANAIEQTDSLLSTAQKFLTENRDALTHDVNNLSDVTTAIMQPSSARRSGDRAAHPAEHGRQCAGDLRARSRQSERRGRVHQLRQPNGVHLQRHSGRQPAGLSGFGGTVRAIPGARPGCDQVQLLPVWHQPVQQR